MASKHELIVCIVNNGFSEAVMDAAREFGARGGTVLHARGTANPEAEKIFHITIQPEKEMVMIIVPSEIKDDILHALYKAVGLNTPGQGIAFSLPVEDTVGLTKPETLSEKIPSAEEKAEPANAETAEETAEKEETNE
ncbi:MAG: P-II family nitrogen regulator [Clostridiales bacterium]|jgi:nitrogen regulatory protein PII|nr:P-II family nitrogen regulator [Clostridiales bacterium]MDY4655921.1 P-II family nitrogen regulator [Eubacteriales bacterium]